MSDNFSEAMTLEATLQWYLDAGVDECIGETPIDRYAESAADQQARAAARAQQSAALQTSKPAGAAGGSQPMRPAPGPVRQPSASPSRPPERPADRMRGEAALVSAVKAAEACNSLDDLKAALADFDGCPLKPMATHTVFADGPFKARVMLIGEAPGEEEDRQGRPFCGPSGTLLDAMLASIGLGRDDVLITNTVFWRPPGNRTPSDSEIAVCLPFLERLITLVDPDVMVALGRPAANTVLAKHEPVSKLRGKWHDYARPGLSAPIATTVLYHPDSLLITPAQKRSAWQDLLAIKAKLNNQ